MATERSHLENFLLDIEDELRWEHQKTLLRTLDRGVSPEGLWRYFDNREPNAKPPTASNTTTDEDNR